MKKYLVLIMILVAVMADAQPKMPVMYGVSIDGDSVTGTTNQVVVTDNGDNSVTLSTPQDIDVGADMIINSAMFNGLSPSRLVQTGAANVTTSVLGFSNYVAGTPNEIEVADDGDGTLTLDIPDLVTLNTVTILNAIGSYGELYHHSGVVEMVFEDVGPTWVEIKNANEASGISLTNGLSDSVTPSGSAGTLTVTYGGVYTLNSSISFHLGSGQNLKEVQGIIAVDDANQNNCHFHRKLGTGADVGSASINCLLDLTAGEAVSFYMNTDTSTNDISLEHINFNITR